MSDDLPSQVELGAIVRGATAFVMDFDGPKTWCIGDTRYITLCSHGLKREGDAAPSFGFQEAVELYGEQLRAMVSANPGKQLAWRCRPKVERQADGGFRVYSRLAFIGGGHPTAIGRYWAAETPNEERLAYIDAVEDGEIKRGDGY